MYALEIQYSQITFFSDGIRHPRTDNNWTGTHDSLISMCRNDFRENFTAASITLKERGFIWVFTLFSYTESHCLLRSVYLWNIQSTLLMIQKKHDNIHRYRVTTTWKRYIITLNALTSSRKLRPCDLYKSLKVQQNTGTVISSEILFKSTRVIIRLITQTNVFK